MAESIVKSCNSKHSVLKEIGKKKLKLLNKMKIFVIGAGGLGNPLLQYLSRFNLKQITIIDYDIVEKSNLERQILFNKKDINKAKAIVALNKIKEFTKTKAIIDNIKNIDNNKIMLNEFKSADLIIDCTDSLGSKKFIFKFCKKHKKTLIYGSVVGTKGYVVTIDFKDTKLNNIIYKTLYDKKPDNTNKSGVYSLAVQGIANLQSTLALKYLLDNKEDINKLYNFDIWHINLKQLRF